MGAAMTNEQPTEMRADSASGSAGPLGGASHYGSDARIPNDVTMAALADASRGIGLTRYGSLQEAIEDCEAYIRSSDD